MACRFGRGQELDPVGKVPSLGGGDLLAPAVGLVEVHAASPAGRPAPQGGGQVGCDPAGRRLRRSPERVEALIGDGVEGGLAAGPEAGDGPPGPARQGADERRALVEDPPGPGHLEGHQAAQGRPTPAAPALSSRASTPNRARSSAGR